MTEIKERAFAKINLHLDITAKNADGYHAVQTVMQTVSLCDEITLTPREDEVISITCNRGDVPCDGSNLAVRAANRYFDAVGMRRGFRIHIEKYIPMAAGMAGGSADAAAVLRGLNRFFGELLAEDDLCRVGARLGADVPFCVMGGTAYAEGIGERLRACAPMPDCYILVACGGEGVSTPWAFGLLDERFSNFDGSCYTPRGVEKLMESMKKGDVTAVAESLYNVFEEPICAERPVAENIRGQMFACGALGAMMSGSGPSVFGIFRDETDAQDAKMRLLQMGVFAEICRPVSQNG